MVPGKLLGGKLLGHAVWYFCNCMEEAAVKCIDPFRFGFEQYVPCI